MAVSVTTVVLMPESGEQGSHARRAPRPSVGEGAAWIVAS